MMEDSEDSANVIHIKNSLMFRNHAYIVFELMSPNRYELIKKICDETTAPKTPEQKKAYTKKICDEITAPMTLEQEKAYIKKICN